MVRGLLLLLIMKTQRSCNKVVFFLTLMATLATLGCGQDLSKTSVSQEPSVYETSDTDLQQFLANVDAVPVGAKEIKNSTTLSWLGQSIPLVKYQVPLNVEFEDISRVLGFAETTANMLLWPVENCSKVGTHNDYRPRDQQYECGEIPYGKILDSKDKLVETLEFEPMKGNQDGLKYSLSGASVPIILRREQKTAKDVIQHLTTKSNQEINISNNIIDNIYYRFSSANGRLITSLCFFSPGLTITSSEQELHFKGKKKVLFLSLKGNADIEVNPGQGSFSKAKVCAAFETIIDSKGLKFQFKKIEAPQLTDIKHAGLDIDVDVDFKGVLKLINNIVKIIGINLEKIVQKKVEEKATSTVDDYVEKIKKEDIETGRWLTKYVSAKIFKGKVVKNLEEALRRQNTTRGPGSQLYLTSMVESACVLLGKTYADKLQGNFVNVCRNSFEVKGQFFLDSPEDKEKGCYASYFSPEDLKKNGQKAWWAEGCKIRSYFEITAPEDFAPLYSCISKLLNEKKVKSIDSTSCSPEIQKLEARLKDQDFSDFVKKAKGRARNILNQNELEKILKDKFLSKL